MFQNTFLESSLNFLSNDIASSEMIVKVFMQGLNLIPPVSKIFSLPILVIALNICSVSGENMKCFTAVLVYIGTA